MIDRRTIAQVREQLAAQSGSQSATGVLNASELRELLSGALEELRGVQGELEAVRSDSRAEIEQLRATVSELRAERDAALRDSQDRESVLSSVLEGLREAQREATAAQLELASLRAQAQSQDAVNSPSDTEQK